MKKFQFTLQRILKYREQLLQREKNELAVLNSQRDAIEGKMIAVQAQVLLSAKRCIEMQEEGVSSMALMQQSMLQDNSRKYIKQLEIELENKQAEIEAQLEKVRLAQQNVTSLEKLKERQLDEYKVEEARIFRDEILEFVTLGLSRQK